MFCIITVILLLAVHSSTAEPMYSPTEAWSALHYCKASYCSSSEITSWTCPSCAVYHPTFTDVTTYTNASWETQEGFVGYNAASK